MTSSPPHGLLRRSRWFVTRRAQSCDQRAVGARLNSRIVIEQAKGVIAERRGLDMADAFATLRGHARSHNVQLVAVATAVPDFAARHHLERWVLGPIAAAAAVATAVAAVTS